MLSIAERDSIRNSTGWSDIILDAISSVEEAGIYIRAGLKDFQIY